MSSSAVFEFNTRKDIRGLFRKLVDAWKPGKDWARSLHLNHRSDRSLQFSAPGPGPNQVEESKQIEAAKTKGRIGEDTPASEGHSQSENGEALRRRADWQCSVGYYFYSRIERKDFEEVVKCIVEYADGDFYYYPDSDISGIFGDPVSINADQVLTHPPSMSNPDYYKVSVRLGG